MLGELNNVGTSVVGAEVKDGALAKFRTLLNKTLPGTRKAANISTLLPTLVMRLRLYSWGAGKLQSNINYIRCGELEQEQLKE